MLNRTAPYLALLVTLLTGPALAQNPPAHLTQLQKDAQELHAYTLTMDVVTRTLIAGHEMDEVIKTDNLGAAMNQARGKGDAATIDQMSATFSISPKLIAIETSHGFTPRSFSVALISVGQTIMSVGAVSSGKSVNDLPVFFRANPANIKLFQDHKQELSALFQKYPVELF